MFGRRTLNRLALVALKIPWPHLRQWRRPNGTNYCNIVELTTLWPWRFFFLTQTYKRHCQCPVMRCPIRTECSNELEKNIDVVYIKYYYEPLNCKYIYTYIELPATGCSPWTSGRAPSSLEGLRNILVPVFHIASAQTEALCESVSLVRSQHHYWLGLPLWTSHWRWGHD